MELLVSMVATMAENQGGINPQEVSFTRRQIREHTQISDTQLRVHLQRLVDLEYLQINRQYGGVYHYHLLYLGEGFGTQIQAFAGSSRVDNGAFVDSSLNPQSQKSLHQKPDEKEKIGTGAGFLEISHRRECEISKDSASTPPAIATYSTAGLGVADQGLADQSLEVADQGLAGYGLCLNPFSMPSIPSHNPANRNQPGFFVSCPSLGLDLSFKHNLKALV